MPIYEYECTKCRHHTEVLQKFSDAPVTECELCHGKMKKLISQSTFHLKGTGWYVTDYASKSGGNSCKKSSSNERASGTKSNDSKESSTKKDSTSVACKASSKKSDSPGD